MKAAVRSKSGEKKGDVSLPEQFKEPVRTDLIRRAVHAIWSHNRQPYGTDPKAGQKSSAKLSRRRRDWKASYGHGISRVQRKIMSHRGTRFNWVGATNPNTVGGRQALPPVVEKVWDRKINTKERRKAIRSAMAASVDKELVKARGHIIVEYPFVLETEIEKISKAKEAMELFMKLGLEEELERAGKRTLKTGRARRRGRTYQKSKGPLVVVSQKCDFMKAAGNIPGIDVVIVNDLNADVLAPGAEPGRLTLYTEASIDMITKQNLFTDNPLKGEEKAAKKEEKKVSKEPKKAEEKKAAPKPAAKKAPAKKAKGAEE
jgi:large subunit ribosomal protein L4e